MKSIVCHGDSLTEGNDLDKSDTWPTIVGRQLKVNVINSGISGDTTGGLLSRFYQDVIRHRPAVVIIMGGTNDLWWDLSINLIQANIFSMACQAQHHSIFPVIGLPLPILLETVQQQEMLKPAGSYEKCVAKLIELVRSLSAAAAQSDVVCLDFYHAFFDKRGYVAGKYFFEDGLHPNQEGHRRMAEIAIQLLREKYRY